MHIVTCVLLFTSIGFAIWQLAIGNHTTKLPLVISIAWCVYGIIPSTLLLYYALVGSDGLGFFLPLPVSVQAGPKP